jgi:ribonucleoside-triphosphate reductase
MVKMLLDKAGINYVLVDAEENKELTEKYGVRKAPTLIVPTKDNNVEYYENASDIKRFIEGYKK